jgi:hypothetical protein
VVVLVLTDHVDELISRQLLLPHHVEESCYLLVRDLLIPRLGLLSNREDWRNRLHFDIARHPHRGPSERSVFPYLLVVLVEGAPSRSPSCRSDGHING